MSIVGALLEQSEIDAIKEQFPNFTGEAPPEAQAWTKADLENFFRSNGADRPRETSTSQSCPLLTQLRLHLAEAKMSACTAEYLSYCRHRQQRSHTCMLPDIASCTPVQRVRECPDKLTAPVTIVPKRDVEFKAQDWGLSFWKQACGHVPWRCQARYPEFEHDKAGPDKVAVDTSIFDYVEYMEVVERMDPQCAEENALAYPRVQIEGWCPFCDVARELLDHCLKELKPPGVRDLTARWVEMFGEICEEPDWKAQLARFYQVSLSVTGSVTRLHAENHGAHAWFMQIEGQKMFFLFPPHDAGKLYEERGGYVAAAEGYTTTASPVDVLFPKLKKHPNFSKATAQVALLGVGKTLVVPAGWWWCSFATEPSVTLKHLYWGMENRTRIVEEFWAPYENESQDVREDAREKFTELREEISADDGSNVEKYVVIEGG